MRADREKRGRVLRRSTTQPSILRGLRALGRSHLANLPGRGARFPSDRLFLSPSGSCQRGNHALAGQGGTEGREALHEGSERIRQPEHLCQCRKRGAIWLDRFNFHVPRYATQRWFSRYAGPAQREWSCWVCELRRDSRLKTLQRLQELPSE